MVLLDETMRLHMRPQIRSIGEGPVANLTLEGLLTSMCTVVALQQPRPREGLATYLALAWKSVRTNMHLQSTGCHIGLVTAFAFEFGVRCGVELIHELVCVVGIRQRALGAV